MYFAVPYDLSPSGAAARAPLSWAYFKERFPLWAAVYFIYTGYWHVTLHWLNWSTRPFIPNRVYQPRKVLHNMFWALGGVVQWVAFENVFAYLWATGRLPYMTDADAFSSYAGMARFIAGLVLVPLWRDSHFYFAHRVLHIESVYSMVHSLHHRNQDIEPFAGLSMHPIEHLYYYSCILPSLCFFASPFHFLWNGIHLVLAPGASHSGFEDHFQADQYHYIHHRDFEYNYAGLGSAFLDVWFGTFRESFKKSDDEKANSKQGLEQPADAKSDLTVMPTADFVLYLVAALGALGAWAYVACENRSLALKYPLAWALLAGFGPLVIAAIMGLGKQGGRKVFENGITAATIHLGFGVLFCCVPVSWAAYLAIV